MDCAQKGISAWRHSVHHWGISPLAICADNSSSEMGLSGSMWFLSLTPAEPWFGCWRSEANGTERWAVRVGRCQSAGSIKAARRRRSRSSLPALNNLGWQKQRVVQGVGLTSAKGNQDKKRSRELVLALTQHLSSRRKEQTSFPALLIYRVQPILGKSIPN